MTAARSVVEPRATDTAPPPAVLDGSVTSLLDSLQVTRDGLRSGEAVARLVAYGPDAVRSHHPVAARPCSSWPAWVSPYPGVPGCWSPSWAGSGQVVRPTGTYPVCPSGVVTRRTGAARWDHPPSPWPCPPVEGAPLDVTEVVPGDVVLLTVGVMAAAYLVLVEGAKRVFSAEVVGPHVHPRRRGQPHRVDRRACAFSHRGRTAGGARGADVETGHRCGYLVPLTGERMSP